MGSRSNAQRRVLTVGASELLARTWKPEYTRGICSVADPTAGPRAKPNCVMLRKNVRQLHLLLERVAHYTLGVAQEIRLLPGTHGFDAQISRPLHATSSRLLRILSDVFSGRRAARPELRISVLGLLQGLGVAGNKMSELLMVIWLGRKGYRNLTSGSLYIALARGATFTWFTFTMIWFWSNWREIDSFGAMLGATGWLAAIGLIGVTSTIALAAWEGAREWLLGIEWNGSSVVRSRYLRTAYATAALVIGLAAVVLSGQPPPEIVYKTF